MDAGNEAENRPNRHASFSDVNDDCLVHVFSFLSLDELNGTVVFVDKHWRRVRDHQSLSQTRVFTIVCSRNNGGVPTPAALRSAFQRVNGALVTADAEHPIHLRVVGLNVLEDWRSVWQDPWSDLQEPSYSALCALQKSLSRRVFKLELVAGGINEPTGNIPDLVFVAIRDYLGWTKYLVVNGTVTFEGVPEDLRHHIFASTFGSQLQEITHVESAIVGINGGEFMGAIHLKRLSLVGCCFEWHRDGSNTWRQEQVVLVTKRWVADRYSDNNGSICSYILRGSHALEHLDIKDATWRVRIGVDAASEPEPLSQAMLVKMVRFHKNLRWFRSDLTDENIAMLKAERPEITLVND